MKQKQKEREAEFRLRRGGKFTASRRHNRPCRQDHHPQASLPSHRRRSFLCRYYSRRGGFKGAGAATVPSHRATCHCHPCAAIAITEEGTQNREAHEREKLAASLVAATASACWGVASVTVANEKDRAVREKQSAKEEKSAPPLPFTASTCSSATARGELPEPSAAQETTTRTTAMLGVIIVNSLAAAAAGITDQGGGEDEGEGNQIRAEHWRYLSQNRNRSLVITAGWSKNKGLRQARPSDEEGAPRRKHGDIEAAKLRTDAKAQKLMGKRGEQTHFDDHGCSADGGGADRNGSGSAVAVTQLEEESGIGG
nr:uncharacterized protein LOC112709045 [Arachis hypogaea]